MRVVFFFFSLHKLMSASSYFKTTDVFLKVYSNFWLKFLVRFLVFWVFFTQPFHLVC